MDGWTGPTTFDATKKLKRDEKLVFCSGNDAPTLFRNLHKRCLTCKDRDTLQACYPLWFMVRLCVLLPGNPVDRAPHIRHQCTRWAALGLSTHCWQIRTDKLLLAEHKCIGFELWCFISTIFQLCGGGQFYRWMKPDRVDTKSTHTHTLE